MKRLCALLLTALLVSVAASCAFAAVTLSGSYYPTTADENFTVTLSQNGVSDVECYSSQYIKSWVEDEMNEGFYDSLESPTAGEIMSVFVLSDIKAPASVDSVFYLGVPDAISSQIGSLQLYFITENMETYALTTVASMPLAGAYDESKKMIALTQLPDVARVRITVAGRELDYRSRQVFLARESLTVPKDDVVGTVDTSLYFVIGDGALTADARTLNLYEGDTQVSAVVRALENGPETKGLSTVLPEGFKVRKVWLEEEICYVSLSSALLEGQPEPETLSQAVLALEQSLLSLESVEEVRFLVDGELADTYGPIDLP